MKVLAALVVMLLVFGLVGCGAQPSSTGGNTGSGGSSSAGNNQVQAQPPVPQAGAGNSLLDEIKKRGTIKIGSTLRFPPEMYRDDKNEPAGYAPELMKMMAKDLDVKLEVVDMDFDGLIPALLAGKVDMVWVGLVNTPKRSLSLEFSRPYVVYRQVVVVPANSPAKTVADLNVSGKKITALLGSTAENLAKSIMPKATVTGFNQQEAMMEVAAGRADGVVLEEYMAIPFVKNNPQTRILDPDHPFSQEMGTIGVRPGDARFLNYLNNWLDYYKARGTLDTMYRDIVLSKLK